MQLVVRRGSSWGSHSANASRKPTRHISRTSQPRSACQSVTCGEIYANLCGDVVARFHWSLVFMFLVLFLSVLVITHVRQSKLASSLSTFWHTLCWLIKKEALRDYELGSLRAIIWRHPATHDYYTSLASIRHGLVTASERTRNCFGRVGA